MAELVAAYQALMNRDNEHLGTDARDSRVALACEIYTLEELRSMREAFDVHSFRVIFDGSPDCGDGDGHVATRGAAEAGEHSNAEGKGAPVNIDNGHQPLDPHPLAPLRVHPDDSISDVKRQLQSSHAAAWGLDGRRVDRDGLHLGWELVHRRRGGGAAPAGHVEVLSYHLFLRSYDVRDDDVLHAVVRR